MRSSLHFACHLQHLHKQIGEFVQEAAAKDGQGVVVGVGACGDVAKGDRVVSGPLYLAAGEHACGVAVHQQGEQGGWMMGLGASACVLACESGQIEAIDDFDHKACQVILREPVIYRGRQQIVCLAVGDNEIGHGARFRATQMICLS